MIYKLLYAIIIILTFSDVSVESKIINSQYVGVVIDTNTFVYCAPDTSSEIISTLLLTDYYLIYDSSAHRRDIFNPPGGWYEIIYSPTKFGWVKANKLRPQNLDLLILKPISDSITILNLQAEPDTTLTFLSGEDLSLDEIRLEITNDSLLKYYHITTKSRKYLERHSGWVAGDELAEEYARLLYNAAEHMSGRNRDIWWGDPMDLRLSKVFYQRMREYGSESFVYPRMDGNFSLNASVTALERLAYVNIQLEQYDSALFYNQLIIDSFPEAKSAIGNAKTVALGEKAKIYLKYLKNYDRGTETCIDIIENHACEVIKGFEWNSTIDLSMVKLISKLKEDDDFNPERVAELLREVFQRSTCAPVKAEALLERIILLREIHYPNKALDEITDYLDERNNVEYQFFKTKIRYQELFYDLYGLICLQDLGDPKRAIEFYQIALPSNISYQPALEYFSIDLLEKSYGNRDQVVERFTRFNADFKWSMYARYRDGLDLYPSSYQAETRAKQIQEFTPFDTSFTVPVDLYLSYTTDKFIIQKIENDTKIEILYRVTFNNLKYFKVETSDKQIGWIKMP